MPEASWVLSCIECARPLLRLGRGGHRAHPQEREEPRQVPAVRGGRHQASDARAVHFSIPGMLVKGYQIRSMSDHRLDYGVEMVKMYTNRLRDFYFTDPRSHQRQDAAAVPAAGREED